MDRAALRETAQGISDTISALGKLGFVEEAGVGRGFSGLALSGLPVGNAGLQGAFSAFCDRWSWGVRSLVQDGNEIAVRLGLNAGVYADAEQYAVYLSPDPLGLAPAPNPHTYVPNPCIYIDPLGLMTCGPAGLRQKTQGFNVSVEVFRHGRSISGPTRQIRTGG